VELVIDSSTSALLIVATATSWRFVGKVRT
jgi:hypothetical protein